MLAQLFSLFSSDTAKSSGSIIDRLTSSDETLERKQQLLLNEKGAGTRKIIVICIVPYTLLLITTLLLCEALDVELSSNFYSIVEKLMYAFGMLMAFYFYYGKQGSDVAQKFSDLKKPVSLHKEPKGSHHASSAAGHGDDVSREPAPPSPAVAKKPQVIGRGSGRTGDFDYVNKFSKNER